MAQVWSKYGVSIGYLWSIYDIQVDLNRPELTIQVNI